MKIKVSEIKGKIIITENGGKILGNADDVVYDTNKMKVIAIISDINSNLNNAKAISIKNIKNISDSIVIKKEDDLKPINQVIQLDTDKSGKATFLAGTKLVTEKGEEIGNIKDISFDSKTGKVAEAKALKQGKENQVKIKKVISSSDQATVIEGNEKKSAEDIIENNPLVKKLQKVGKSLSKDSESN